MKEITEFFEPPEAICNELDEKEFEDYLNDLYGDVDVCGMSMPAGSVLREMDDCAFRTARNDHNSTQDVWECPICHRGYNEESDAQECCFDGEFGCPTCGSQWNTRERAMDCCDENTGAEGETF